VRSPERVRSLVEGPPDHLAPLELQEELGLLRVRHHAHLHQAHLHLQPGRGGPMLQSKIFLDF
jgi:hypothetical protein